MRLDGSVALIADGPGGVGRAIATRFAEEGASVVESASPADPEDIVASTVARFGRLDVVVGTVSEGEANGRLLADVSPDQFRSTLEHNLTSQYMLARAAIPEMERAGGGTFVFVSSSQGLYPSRGFSAYSIAKAGAAMLAKAIAVDYGQAGIRANVVCPGVIESEYDRAAMDGMRHRYLERSLVGQLNSPEDVAAAAAFLASDGARNVQGAVLQLDGGINLRHFASFDFEPLLAARGPVSS